MELHRKEKREREIEVTRRRRGTDKRRQTNLASNQFPVFSTVQKTQRDSHIEVEKRRGSEEINLENSAVATGLEKVSFHFNPKERQCQTMLKLPHNCTHLTR